ncbi:MAG: MetQ/NlpA family ABC transporter substrate-binding protein [Selenomonas sp.]|nr:MetQ/NlpA family ABC transporter substrate-binding protein [Selenomonas sp.]
MKKLFILFFTILSTLAFAACGAPQASKSEPLPKLTIGLMPDVDSLPFIIAQEKGYFKEEGLDIELQQFKSAMDRDAALQSGTLDGDVSDMLAVAFAKDGGFDVKVTSYTDGSYKLIAGAAESATEAKGLAGKDVAVSRNTIIEYVTDQILAKAGMTGDSINKVIIPQIPTRLEMLQNGKLAAATLPEPMASIAVANGCHYVTGSDQLGINPGVIMFTEKSTQDKKASIQAMYRAYNKAVKYLNETPQAEYMDIVIEKGGFPQASKDSLKLPQYHEAALPKDSDVTDCIAWLKDKGLIQESYSYDDIVLDLLTK